MTEYIVISAETSEYVLPVTQPTVLWEH